MFFIFVLLIMIFMFFAIHTSKIGIEIENFIFDTESNKKVNKECRIIIYLLIFNKIKVFKKDVKKILLKKIKFEKKDIDILFAKNKDIKINYLDLLQNIKIDIINIDLNIDIGIEDCALTAIITGIVSSIIGIILKKPKYKICPIYNNKNLLKINLNGIFRIYLMQYIYKLIKKIYESKKAKLAKENLINQRFIGISKAKT